MKKLLAFTSLLIALMIPSCGFASVTVSSPTSGATVQSPVKFVASARSYDTITGMVIYVDSQDVYSTKASSLNTSLSMSVGTHAIVVKAWNAQGKIYSDSFSLKVTSATTTPTPTALKLTTTALANGTVGTAYSAALQASGGTSPYTWSVVSGSLPAGLTLSTSGTISGTPTAAGTSSFSLTVKDSASSQQAATSSFTLTVAAAAASSPAPTGSGPQYYVSSTGSDSNKGTSTSSAWETITHACSSVSAGATINVMPGTYTEAPVCSVSGTSSSPIIIQAQYPATANASNRSIFSYQGSSIYDYWTINGSYVQIIGFEITGPNASVGIMNEGSHNLMQWNVVHDIGTSVACNDDGGAAIDDGNYSGGYNTMNANNVYSIGEMVDCNYFHGLYESGQHSLLYNNLVSNTQSQGITTYHAAYNVTIANNTVFHFGYSSGGSCYGYGIHIDADTSKYPKNDYTFVANNIVYGGVGCGGFGEESADTGTHNVYVNNDSYDNDGNSFAITNGTVVGTMTSNPGFADYLTTGLGNYAPASSTAYMVGKGISNATAATYNSGVSGENAGSIPPTDYTGATRPSTGVDIGAYQ